MCQDWIEPVNSSIPPQAVDEFVMQNRNEFQNLFEITKIATGKWRNAFCLVGWCLRLSSLLCNVIINSAKMYLQHAEWGGYFCQSLMISVGSWLPRRRSRCVARYTCLSFWICWLILLLASLRCLLSSASDLEALRPKQPMTVDQASECAGGCESGSVPPTA